MFYTHNKHVVCFKMQKINKTSINFDIFEVILKKLILSLFIKKSQKF